MLTENPKLHDAKVPKPEAACVVVTACLHPLNAEHSAHASHAALCGVKLRCDGQLISKASESLKSVATYLSRLESCDEPQT